MKRSTLSVVLLACLVVALLIVTAFTAVSAASAQLGNTGVPVRCWTSITPGNAGKLQCAMPDGQVFTNVPAGHYLMVTDVVVTPIGSSATSWAELAQKRAADDKSEAELPFFSETVSTLGMHFSVPCFVLPADRYLYAEANMVPGGGGIDYYVSGLLTTNVNWMPLVAR